MQKALHIRTTVLSGGKAAIASPKLEAGQSVDVVVTRSSSTERRSVVDILAEAPGASPLQDWEGSQRLHQGRERIVGPLSLPTHGPVYFDANGFIYSVELVEPYRTLLEPMWQQARAGEFDVASSDITVLEPLVKPLREGNKVVEMLLRSMFDAHEVSLVPATRELWEDAARICADTGLTTPDALHAATALSAGCALFITIDTDFRRVEGLPIVVLDDLIEAEAEA